MMPWNKGEGFKYGFRLDPQYRRRHRGSWVVFTSLQLKNDVLHDHKNKISWENVQVLEFTLQSNPFPVENVFKLRKQLCIIHQCRIRSYTRLLNVLYEQKSNVKITKRFIYFLILKTQACLYIS